MLALIDKKTINISKKIKFQLLLLPLLITYLMVYFINEKFAYKENNIENKFDFETKIFKDSYLELIREIEGFCLKNKIKIIHISNKNTTLNITAKSSLTKFKKLIYKLETINDFSNIHSLHLNKSKSFIYKIELSFEKYYLKSILTNNEKTKKKREPLKLKAIIANFVLINNKWLKINEFIDDYEIIEIGSSYVKLKKDSKNLLLKVHKNEKFINKFY